MKISLRILALTSLTLIGGAFSADAARKAPSEGAPFKWAPQSQAAKASWHNLPAKKAMQKAAPEFKADFAFSEGDTFSYLDMPDGSTWFVVANYDKEIIVEDDYYTDYSIKGVSATVYDSSFNAVAKIDDTITCPEGYEKCSSVQFGAAVTRKFFNVDDAYEVMLMANFKPTGAYGADPFTYIYSLQDPSANSERIATMPGYYTCAINNSTSSWSEDFFMEFFTKEEYTDTEMLYTFSIFSKANYSSPKAPVLLKDITVDMVYCMSDGENEALPVIINSKGTDLYVSVARYEKTFFVDPFDYFNEQMNEDNNYTITLYRKSGSELVEQSVTKIPCEGPADGYFMRSYCIGQFLGATDLTFDFTPDGSPAYIISIVDTDINENTIDYFSVYATDGSVIKTFGANNGGYLQLSSVPGQNEQFVFLEEAPSGDYGFQFYDYPSMERLAFIPPVVFTGVEDLSLSLNIDRVAGSADGYRYAVASLYGDEDEAANTFHQVAWFNRAGEIEKVDRLNAGQNVNRILPYVVANGLDPYMFNTDTSREYMILVQRAASADAIQAHTEFCIVNDKEEMLLQRAFKQYDSSIGVSLVNEKVNPAVWITWRDAEDGLFHNEFVTLPLNKLQGEGTAEKPYLISAPGDLSAISGNLSANYRVENDFHCDYVPLDPVKGNFIGTLDGNGHTISGLAIVDSPLFGSFGSVDASTQAVMKDITFNGVTVNGSAPAVLAGKSYNAQFNNVRVANAEVSTTSDEYGSLVNNTFQTSITGCAFKGNVEAPNAELAGGLVGTLGLGSSVIGSSVSGVIEARSGLGGIASMSRADARITDCHVDADLSACHSIGGVVAESARSLVARNFVEGNITATQAGTRRSTITYQPYNYIHVGGIAGVLTPPYNNSDGSAPSTDIVMDGNVVALASISIPEGDDLLSTAHRIVGRSSVNDDPEIKNETYNEQTGEWEFVFGDPAPAEPYIANNYALAGLNLIHSEVADDHTTTEGKTLAATELTKTFLEGLGYKFDGNSATAPWLMNGEVPVLWFEESIPQSGISETVIPERSPITYVGGIITAPGLDIELYSLNGLLVARGHGELSTLGLAPGIYVAATPGHAIKIALK